MLDKINRINLLYDIYSSLLTVRQQEVLQLYFSDNLSMGEIAAAYGISRQAVHDLIQRALKAIEGFEEKLGLYELFCAQQKLLQEAERLLEQPPGPAELQRLKEIINELRRKNEQ
ncbi:MAG: YlxM family DNA-binding protein [Firmicutes bacterium]|nr:YlxM family DNA-binding protein [Bacillota bacterium]HPU01571.1 YlxM family DNA-binding protein [Bacillota bacterium]